MEIISKNKIFAENYKSFLLKNLLIIEKNNKTSFCFLEDKKESLYYYNYKTVKLNKNLNTKKHILSINEYYDIDEFILENKLTKGLLKNYLNLINNFKIDKKKRSFRFFREIKHRNFKYLFAGQHGKIFVMDKKKIVWCIKQKPKRIKKYKERFQYKNFRDVKFKFLEILPIPKKNL